MIEVERHFDHSKDTHPIYTKEEADEKDLDYVYWKDADEGDWAITDDEYVCRCKRVTATKKNKEIALTGGTAWDSENAEIHFEQNHEIGVYSYMKPQTHMSKEVKSRRAKQVIDIYCRLRTKGVKHSDMPWDRMGQIYRPDQEIPRATVQRLFKTEKVKEKVSERIVEILEDEGFSDRELIREYKEVLEEAKDDGDLTNARLTLDSVAEMKGVDEPDTEKVTNEQEATYHRKITEDVQEEKKKLKQKRTKEIPEQNETSQQE